MSEAGTQYARTSLGNMTHARALLSTDRLTIGLLGAYLAAITIFGKGPTYLGIPPIYWGEMVLGICLIWMVQTSARLGPTTNFPHALTTALFFFMTQGAIRLLVDLWFGQGMDAARDSAIWYYGLFFFVGFRLARMPFIADRLWARLQVIWALALLWHVANYLTNNELIHMGPVTPHRGGRLLGNSGSEAMQHVYLAVMMVMIGPARLKKIKFRLTWLVPAVPMGVFLVLFSWTRAIKVAALASSSIGLFASAGGLPRVWRRTRLFGMVYLLIGAGAISVVASSPEAVYQRGNFQRFENMVSETQGTAYWRRIWWENLHREVMEENLLFGLGFGASLHIHNPEIHINPDPHWPIRSPHNINMTIYSRMGWMGLLTWVVILLSGIGGLFVFVRRGRNRWGPYSIERRKELTFWLIMLTATWVNSSFGVLMEGPVLGIWFWFALGFAQGRARCPEGVRGKYIPPTIDQSDAWLY